MALRLLPAAPRAMQLGGEVGEPVQLRKIVGAAGAQGDGEPDDGKIVVLLDEEPRAAGTLHVVFPRAGRNRRASSAGR